jgi:hypothetical protein
MPRLQRILAPRRARAATAISLCQMGPMPVPPARCEAGRSTDTLKEVSVRQDQSRRIIRSNRLALLYESTIRRDRSPVRQAERSRVRCSEFFEDSRSTRCGPCSTKDASGTSRRRAPARLAATSDHQGGPLLSSDERYPSQVGIRLIPGYDFWRPEWPSECGKARVHCDRRPPAAKVCKLPHRFAV